jgi:hypothetical protein
MAKVDDRPETLADPGGCVVLELQLGHLVERARDADGAVAEADGHSGHFGADDAAETVGVVRDQVTALELLDDRLGVRLERAAGEMAPPRG